MANGLSVEVNLNGLFEQLDGISERVGDAVRYSTYMGAVIMRQEAELRAPRSQKKHYFYSKGSVGADGKAKRYEFNPGDLKKSIYIKYLDGQSTDLEKATYQISYRKNSSKLGYVPYGSMVHEGVRGKNHVIAPNRFISHAYDAKRNMVNQRIISLIQKAANGDSDYRSDFISVT